MVLENLTKKQLRKIDALLDEEVGRQEPVCGIDTPIPHFTTNINAAFTLLSRYTNEWSIRSDTAPKNKTPLFYCNI